MSWELRVWTPNRGALKATYTDTSPGGVAEGFRWSVRGDGNCEQMRFSAVPSMVDIGPRDIVQLVVDGTPVFYGYIETAWPPLDGRLREYVAVGAAELLRARLMDDRTYDEQDVGAIVRDIAARRLHPAIIHSGIRVQYTGVQAALHDGLGMDLYRVFDDLAASAGATWGVDASGVFFFGRLTTSVVVDYEEHGLEWLPVEADEIVTRVVVIQHLDEQGRVLWHAYEDPAHALYGAEKAVVVGADLTPPGPAPSSVSVDTLTDTPQQTTDGGVSWQAWDGSATYLLDPDPNTGLRAYEPPPDPGSICFDGLERRGVWIAWGGSHHLDSVAVDAASANGGDLYLFYDWYDGGVLRGDGRRIGGSGYRGYVSIGRLVRRVGVGVVVPCSNLGPWDIRVFRLAPVAYGYGLQTYASSLIRLPYERPAEVEWQGYQPPAASVTITGAPGGDLTGPVETWEYELSPRRFATRARLGSRGLDETTRAIRIVADRRRETAEGTALALMRRR